MTPRFVLSSLTLALLSLPAFAQTAPDAGQILQEVKRPPAQPGASKVPDIQMPGSAAVTLPGGAQVTLNAVAITGNTLFDQATLATAIGDVSGRHFDLAGLRELADRITTHYRSKGYPFTRSVIPPQDMKDGVLRIQVLEGRYGKVEATSSDAWLASGSQKFLGALQTGGVIESTDLERVMLILGNQPGIKIMPVISPGQQTGAGDLNVKVERESNYSGQIGIDNAGSRYTGEYRFQATLNANSQMLFGDRLTLRGMVSDHSMWLGSVDYEAPIGGSGLRGQIGYGDNYYQLGGQFAALDATGFAKVTSARLSYPILRSQASNVTVSGAYQNKRLEERYGATGTVNEKSSNSWPVAVQFDHRDRFGGGGITYGMATWTSGNLNLNGAFAATDAATAQTAGHFNKYRSGAAPWRTGSHCCTESMNELQFETLRAELEALSVPEGQIRDLRWLAEPIAAARTTSGDFEVFIRGPELRANSSLVRRHLQHGAWRPEHGGEPFFASRIDATVRTALCVYSRADCNRVDKGGRRKPARTTDRLHGRRADHRDGDPKRSIAR